MVSPGEIAAVEMGDGLNYLVSSSDMKEDIPCMSSRASEKFEGSGCGMECAPSTVSTQDFGRIVPRGVAVAYLSELQVQRQLRPV